jgi:hypothetical protein
LGSVGALAIPSSAAGASFAELPREQLKAAVSPMMYSFMTESRSLSNDCLRRELNMRLDFTIVNVTMRT